MCHWMGDTFWDMQVIPEVKKLYPNAELWAGVKPFTKDLLYDLVDENKIIILQNVISDRHREEFSFASYISELKKVRAEKFDIAIDLTLNRYSAIFLTLTKIKQKIGLNIHNFSFLYNKKGPRFDDNKHLSERPWETLKTIDPKIQKQQWPFPPKSPVSQSEIETKTLINLHAKIALLSPGAGWPEKQWPIEAFAVCGKFLIDNGYKIIISGTEKERNLCEQLNVMLNKQGIIFIETLNYFISLIPYIKLAIMNDSGPAHLIAVNGIQTIAIFLSTNKTRCGPIGKNTIIIDKNEAIPELVISKIRKLG